MQTTIRMAGTAGVAIAAVASAVTAPAASASVASFCDQIGGQWNGQYCHASVATERKAVREINIAIPAEIDGPIGGVIADYLTTLMNNWRSAGKNMAYDSWGDANFEIFQHGGIRTPACRSI